MAKIKALLGTAVVVVVLPIIVAFGTTTAKAGETVIDMRDFRTGDLAVDGFKLKEKTRLSIEAIGAESKYSDEMFAYGWILDAKSREPVWVLNADDTERYKRSKYLREYSGELTLDPGSYEAYFYVGSPYYFSGISTNLKGLDGVFEIIGDIFDSDEVRKYDGEYTEDSDLIMMTINAPEGSFEKYDPVKIQEENSFVDLSKPDDDFYEKKGFTLDRDMKIKIDAIGEYSSGDRIFVDYGWIINADTREKIWSMDRWNTSWAGGGRKNRGFVGEIELPAGNYLAFVGTDDSHSFGAWNVPPPYDPLHYGMVLYTLDPNDKQYIHEYQDQFAQKTIISLTRVRNSQFKQMGFILKEPMELHILAIGEIGSDDNFADYGWIEDYNASEVVWEMTADNTEHAGGARKNRKFDGNIKLPAGTYAVYYVTDDSHAYRDWNASPPIDKDLYGITISGVGKDFDESKIEVLEDLPKNTNFLVDLTGVGNDEDVREKFTLDKDGKVRISALGEGSSGDMYDYGWIEKADNGDVVWEMTYRKTRHAGGANKNRMVNQSIYLEKGSYYAYYVTDGSHSFPDFNASPPMNPQKWGIMISLEK